MADSAANKTVKYSSPTGARSPSMKPAIIGDVLSDMLSIVSRVEDSCSDSVGMNRSKV